MRRSKPKSEENQKKKSHQKIETKDKEKLITIETFTNVLQFKKSFELRVKTILTGIGVHYQR